MSLYFSEFLMDFIEVLIRTLLSFLIFNLTKHTLKTMEMRKRIGKHGFEFKKATFVNGIINHMSIH